MNLRRLSLIGAALLMSIPTFASTYYGGFEDTKDGDYDYNDIVFTLSGNGLTLNTSDGHWYNKPMLGNSGAPFWNNASYDNGNKNVGFCVYGGGDCGAGLNSTARYLARNDKSHTGSANDVTFSAGANQNVVANVVMEISGYTDVLGYYNTSDPSKIYWLNTSGQTGTFQLVPTGTFGVVAKNGVHGPDQTFYSQSKFDGIKDNVSHFAFFGDTAAAPEPGAMGLMAGGLIMVGALFRRRKVEV